MRISNTVALSLLAIPVLGTWCAAQTPVHIEKVVSNPADINHPGVVTIQDFPDPFKTGFDTMWNQNRDQMNKIVTGLLAFGNDHHFFPKGYTLYNQKSLIGSGGKLTDSLDGANLMLTYFVPGNYLEFTSTVPANNLGKDLDPRFSVTYDMTLKITIPIASALTGLQASNAAATISNISKPDSHNFTGDLGLTVASIVSFLGGPDVAAQLTSGLNNRSFMITQQVQAVLGTVNSPLQQLSQQGFTMLTASVATASHTLMLRTAPAMATIRTTVNTAGCSASQAVTGTSARVKYFDTVAKSKLVGRTRSYALTILSDARMIPIHIDILRTELSADREAQQKNGQTGRAAAGEAFVAGSSVIRSLDLIYDRYSGNISGSVNGSVGREMNAGSNTLNGPNLVLTVTDDGPKPTNGKVDSQTVKNKVRRVP